MSNSLQPHGLYSRWNSSGQNSLSLLQGIFPTQGLNSGLSHCRQILYQLSHNGSPRILEWVAYPFSSGSSWPRNWTWVSCITGGFFTNWAIREALLGRKAMTNLDSREITLPTKVHLVKTMVFLVVMYGCENWTIKRAEHWRIDGFKMWC